MCCKGGIPQKREVIPGVNGPKKSHLLSVSVAENQIAPKCWRGKKKRHVLIGNIKPGKLTVAVATCDQKKGREKMTTP